jgi:hypothetical protein
LVLAGVTVANIFGVRAGTALGQAMGWRSTLGGHRDRRDRGPDDRRVVAGQCPERWAAERSARVFKVLGKSQVLLALALSSLLTAAFVTVYAYIAPLLEEVTGIVTCKSASNFDPRRNNRKPLSDKLFVENIRGHDWTPINSPMNPLFWCRNHLPRNRGRVKVRRRFTSGLGGVSHSLRWTST